MVSAQRWFSTYEESLQITPGIIWWSQLLTSSPPTVPCTCYGPHRGPEAAPAMEIQPVCRLKSRLATFSPQLGHRTLDSFVLKLLPPVRATLANSPCLASGDFFCLAEEVDHVPCSTRHFSIYRVALDILQPAVDNRDPGDSNQRRCGNLCFFHRCFGRKAPYFVLPCTFKVMGNAKASTQLKT